jgi:hypothetical protein
MPLPSSARRLFAAALAALLSGCAAADFSRAPPRTDEATYAEMFPYYAELCAVSQIRKKPGFGPDIVGGVGGHAVLYLNGACRDMGAGYPTLRLCDEATARAGGGAGVSANAHFSNANWIATDGRDFLYHGDLRPGDRLTREVYARTQRSAEDRGLLDGVIFHREVFADQPAGMSRRDFMYEMSVSTDYAIGFGRGRFCARVPLSPARMARAIAYLNGRNALYKDGSRTFEWDVLRNNCSHLTHNALAAAGVWPPEPTDQFLPVAALTMPVPRNEFVDLARRAGESGRDPARLRRDPVARAWLAAGELPPGPGAIVESEPPAQTNDLYDTSVSLIFYDDPVFGPYRPWSDAILTAPRYTDLDANLAWFAGRDRDALATPATPGDASWRAAMTRESKMLARDIAWLRASRGLAEGAAPAPGPAGP